MKLYIKIIIAILIILSAVFLLFNTNKSTGFVSLKNNNNKTIKIGAMFVLSGEGSSWGQASQRAVNLAINEINNNGGINGNKVKVFFEDTQGIPKNAISAYRKLKDVDDVTAIIGPNMLSELGVIEPIASKDNFPIITPAFIQNNKYLRNPLMVWEDPKIEAESMAEYVYNNGIKSISIIGTQDAWEKEVSTDFRNKFQELGGKIDYFQLLKINDNEISTTITKAIKNKPKAIFVGTYYKFIDITKKLKEQGYNGKLYSIEVDDYLAKQTNPYTNNLEFIAPDIYTSSFVKKYEKTYNTKITIPAGQVYDATNILLDALKKSTKKENILKYFQNIKEYNGVSGKIKFKNNQTTMSMAIYKIENGDISRIKDI